MAQPKETHDTQRKNRPAARGPPRGTQSTPARWRAGPTMDRMAQRPAQSPGRPPGQIQRKPNYGEQPPHEPSSKKEPPLPDPLLHKYVEERGMERRARLMGSMCECFRGNLSQIDQTKHPKPAQKKKARQLDAGREKGADQADSWHRPRLRWLDKPGIDPPARASGRSSTGQYKSVQVNLSEYNL